MLALARPGRCWLAAALLIAAVAAPAQAAERPTQRVDGDWSVTGPQVFDALVLRPLGAVATLVGSALFVPAAPLAAFSVGVGSVWDTFVMEPVDFTFLRPLGDF